MAIDWFYIMYNEKNGTNQNNVTRISMATKYPIIKHRAFFKTFNRGIDSITHSYWTDSYKTSHGEVRVFKK